MGVIKPPEDDAWDGMPTRPDVPLWMGWLLVIIMVAAFLAIVFWV